MFEFPANLYTDVRIEDLFETKVLFKMGKVEENRVRRYKAAFIRVFDGAHWYFESTSNLGSIQEKINQLAGLATPRENIENHPVVKRFQINKAEDIRFQDNSVDDISIDKKLNLLEGFFPILDSSSLVKMWQAYYLDRKIEKEFYSSKGANLKFDTQIAGFSLGFDLVKDERKFSESFQKAFVNYDQLEGREDEFKEYLQKCEDFLLNSVSVEPGNYTVVMAPKVAGVFAHESFGHKSEADFMIGDKVMKEEWKIGKRVGSEILSIVDDGNRAGSGYLPYDDEGTKTEETYLIKDGILSGRLHSASTAASLDEEVTGNARAINFEYEPIVRMSTTFIKPGKQSREELISNIDKGIYIETFKHGSGMSTFTIAPSLAYYIREGKVAEPVNISVVTGNVMETLGKIDGVSDRLELISSVRGGCGKMEQFPLPVAFGGPYIRVRDMNVQ